MSNDLTRIVDFAPAFDRRDPDPLKNYGIHGVELRMVLKGPLGAVQFLVFTNWQLPRVTREFAVKAFDHDPDWLKTFFCPMGADVGYHSPKPIYDGQEPMGDACDYLDGKPCYYDGSGLAAEDMLPVLIAEGSDAVWAKLEARYNELFALALVTAGAE